MKKAVIGVVPLFDVERDSLWMLPAYLQCLKTVGALPVILPLEQPEDSRQMVQLCDGILITGGQDVDPALYGQTRLERCGEPLPALDRLGEALLREAMVLDLPVLGICRGLQLINVCLGGTLWQDLPSQRPGGRNHRMERPYNRAEHPVSLTGPLAALYGSQEIGVNSCHHQGIQTLAPCLRPMALSDDGVIEAAFHPDQRFLWAVQWHPEFFDPVSGPGIPIFRAFAEAAKGKQN